MKSNYRTILGIDPGLATTGYGILRQGEEISSTGGGIHPPCEMVEAGIITTQPEDTTPVRLRVIYQEIKSLIEKHKPDVMAVEEVYLSNNQKTAIIVAQARGVALLAGCEMEVRNFTPLQMKKQVTGYGKANKDQVCKMVRQLLNLKSIPQSDHTADALGVALSCGMEGRLAALKKSFKQP